MYAIQKTSKDSWRGKVMKALVQAHGKGVRIPELQAALSAKNEAVIRTAVLGLRDKGYRIDYVDRSYILKGVGSSYTKHHMSGKMIPMRKKRKVLKPIPNPPQVIKKPAVTSKISNASPTPTSGGDVFVIVPDLFQKALAVLPEKKRTSIMDFSRKLQAYNQIIRFYRDADRKMEEMSL